MLGGTSLFKVNQTKLLYEEFGEEPKYFGQKIYEESYKRRLSKSRERSQRKSPYSRDVWRPNMNQLKVEKVVVKDNEVKRKIEFDSQDSFTEHEQNCYKETMVQDKEGIRDTLKKFDLLEAQKEFMKKSSDRYEDKSVTVFKCSDNLSEEPVYKEPSPTRPKQPAQKSFPQSSPTHDPFHQKESFVSMMDRQITNEGYTETWNKPESMWDKSRNSSSIKGLSQGTNSYHSEVIRQSPVSMVVKSRPNRPYLFIDVVINKTEQHSISVYEGDTPEFLAQEFVEAHHLAPETYFNLLVMIRQQIEQAKRS